MTLQVDPCHCERSKATCHCEAPKELKQSHPPSTPEPRTILRLLRNDRFHLQLLSESFEKFKALSPASLRMPPIGFGSDQESSYPDPHHLLEL